ncbi:hypothetical protein GXB81_18145 [Paraburkholderia sp. Ac-20336]|uniref:hypothetical protein n=1 Tax=Paraburkholderia sp. Ac-20336 TaxID=2703886 RepID=UPI0019821BE3|nr:hypothetical protein [Paraburkholderia sp. Ac-20336]MBN3804957.1 hypothetical protein [Paraburkholderia sp. Ac-20336]
MHQISEAEHHSGENSELHDYFDGMLFRANLDNEAPDEHDEFVAKLAGTIAELIEQNDVPNRNRFIRHCAQFQSNPIAKDFAKFLIDDEGFFFISVIAMDDGAHCVDFHHLGPSTFGSLIEYCGYARQKIIEHGGEYTEWDVPAVTEDVEQK